MLRGIAHIRGHETDRLAALARELGGLGADVAETDDGLAFRPAALHGGLFHTYADHRMAHAGVVVGAAVDGVLVEDVATTGKTFPGLPRRLERCCAVSPGQRRYGEEDQEHYDRPRRRTRPRTKERPTYDDAHDGLVLTVDRGRYGVVVDDLAVTAMKARPLGRKGVVVGDRVRVVGDVSGDEGALARIVEVAERSTTLRRSADDDDAVERVIVANADQLVIVSALADPEPRTGLIDRALVAAFDAGMKPLLCLTKADLADPETLLVTYRPLGVPWVVTRKGGDLAELRGPPARADQRAARPQRRRQVHARQRAGARRRPRDRPRQRRHRAGPAHLDLGDHAAPAGRPPAGSSTPRASAPSGWRTCSRST